MSERLAGSANPGPCRVWAHDRAPTWTGYLMGGSTGTSRQRRRSRAATRLTGSLVS